MMFSISRSVSSGSEHSVSSPMLVWRSLTATLTRSSPTKMEARGSSMVHRWPSTMAPPMPMAVPMDERASLR